MFVNYLRDYKHSGWLDNFHSKEHKWRKGRHLRLMGAIHDDDNSYPKVRPRRYDLKDDVTIQAYLHKLKEESGSLERKAERKRKAGRSDQLEDKGDAGSDAEGEIVPEEQLTSLATFEHGGDEAPHTNDPKGQFIEQETNEVGFGVVAEEDLARRLRPTKRLRFDDDVKQQRAEEMVPHFDLLKQLVENGMHNAAKNHISSVHQIRNPIDRLEGLVLGRPSAPLYLTNHQKDGVGRWEYLMKTYSAALLADEPGSGKRLIIIGVIVRALNEAAREGRKLSPFLIVMNKPLFDTWMKEFARVPWMKVYAPLTIKEATNDEEAYRHDVVLLTSRLLVNMCDELAKCQRDFTIIQKGYEAEVIELRRRLHQAKRLTATNQSRFGDLDEAFMNERSNVPLFSMKYHQVIIDDAHHMRNDKTKLFHAMCLIRANGRGGMTGTPFGDGAKDFGSFLQYMRIRPFDDPAVFTACFTNKQNVKILAKTKRNAFWSSDCILSCIRSAITIRREQNQDFDGGPILGIPAFEHTMYLVKLSPDAQEYQERTRSYWDRDEIKAKKNWGEDDPDMNDSDFHDSLRSEESVLVEILRARLHAIHPSLINASYGEFGIDNLSGLRDSAAAGYEINLNELRTVGFDTEQLTDDGEVEKALNHIRKQYNENQLGKADKEKLAARRAAFLGHFKKSPKAWRPDKLYQTAKITAKRIAEHTIEARKLRDPAARKDYLATHKVLVFCEYLSALDVLAIDLQKEFGISVSRFDSTSSQEDRDRVRQAFEEDGKDFENDDDAEPDGIQVMLITNKIIAEGIALVHVSDIVILAPCWVPYIEDQLLRIAVRAGYIKRTVTVYRLWARDSVEDSVLAKQYEKRQLVSTILSDDFIVRHTKAMRKVPETRWAEAVSRDMVASLSRKLTSFAAWNDKSISIMKAVRLQL